MTSDLLRHLDKNNLHHAYLIEGEREEIIPEVVEFAKKLKVEVIEIKVDSFKIEDARNLKSYALERGQSGEKRIFLISANNFLLEGQNSMLKMFEEPIENTHFFVVVPEVNSLLKTFVSRFYFISLKSGVELEEAEKFIAMPLQRRIDFVKELTAKTDDEDDETEIVLDSTRSKTLRFLNSLEVALHKQGRIKAAYFHQIFQVRKFLRMPGSSAKTLMESVALIMPNFKS